MFRLILLGGVDLRDHDDARVTEIISQPKRLALLAYLAVSPNPVRRDKLLALFWPESDAQRARRALNQAVHTIRRTLGAESIITRGAEDLAVDPSVVSCDVVELAHAPVPEITRRYRGPFMDGFHLDGLPEFDEWMSEERRRIQTAVEAAVWHEIDAAAARKETRRALELARFIERWTSVLDETALRRLMKLYDSLGDRAAALRLYDAAEKKLAAEYDAEPGPETRALRDTIRERQATVMEDALAPLVRRKFAGRRALAAPALLLVALLLFVGYRAVYTTRSIAAWRAYAQGETDYRAGRYSAAQDAFHRAVDADSSFALAYLGLSMAANWTGESALADWAANNAVARETRMRRHDRMRVDAWAAYLRGAADVATPMYEAMVKADPDDADAWFHLADLQFHWGPMLGTPVRTSLAGFRESLSIDSHNAGAWVHLARAAAASHEEAAFDSAASALQSLDPGPSELIELRALKAFSFGNTAARQDAADEVGTLSEELGESVVHTIAFASYDFSGIDDVLLPALWSRRTFNSRPTGQMLLKASVQLARGDFAGARATIDSTTQIQAWRAFEYRAYATALPFGFADSAEQAKMLDVLTSMKPFPDERSFAPANRAFFAGLIALSLKDNARALQQVSMLNDFVTTDSRDSAYAHYYSRVLRADLFRRAGETGKALEVLGPPGMQPDLRLPFVFSYAKAYERFLRAELLEALGRKEEALRWYATFPEPGASDLVYVAHAQLRMAALTQGAESRAHRARFEALWRHE